MTPETQIQSEIDLLRTQVEDTQELYREACALLFFRYGVTPTANKLYQYVRKGSMSAPAQALARFWEELRDKSRIRIENPDLPETLRDAAGELIAALWKQALTAAQQELEVFRSESRAALQEAESARHGAQRALEARDQECAQIRQAARDTTAKLEQSQTALIEERTQKIALDGQLRTTSARLADAEKALAGARQDFAAELEKMRRALALVEERCQATERRALLAIDQERSTLVQTQKELQQTRQQAGISEERHRAELTRLQDGLSTLRQKLSGAEANIEENRSIANDQAGRLLALGGTLAEKETKLEFLARDLESAQQSLATAEAQLLRLRSIAKAKRNLPSRASTVGGRKRNAA